MDASVGLPAEDFLRGHPRLHLDLLPPYQPGLNTQERIRRQVRFEAATNRCFFTLEQIRATVNRVQEDDRLHITAIRAQRLYNNRTWPNPVVLKIIDAEVGMSPPKVKVGVAEWDPKNGIAVLHATLTDLGRAQSVQVGFEYQRRKEEWEMYGPDIPWKQTAFHTMTKAAAFSAEVSNLKKDGSYEFRAIVKHPLITLRSPDHSFGKVSAR